MANIVGRATLGAALWLAAGPLWADDKLVPLPPGTGPFTIQLFVGKTQRVIVALDPPKMYAGGAKIPDGTPFAFKLYRSVDGAKTYQSIPIASGEKGTIGKPYGAIALNVPVNDEPPYLVILGASVVIKGVESEMTTSNLTFAYFPGLSRFPTPKAALKKTDTPDPVDPKAKLAPSPPGTGPFTVQLFVGKTQRVLLALDPPKTFVGGAKIPAGTSYSFKIYRSLDGVKAYKSMPIVSGEQGTTGQPYGAIALDVPVNDEPPYLVFLGASVVVNGVESAMVTDNLTFGYFPDLIRYASPKDALKGKESKKEDTPFSLGGDWTLLPEGHKVAIRIDGKKFTGKITHKDGVSAENPPLELVGTVMGQTYEFRWSYTFKGEVTQGDARLTLSSDHRNLEGEVEYRGTRAPARFAIEGRNLRVLKK